MQVVDQADILAAQHHCRTKTSQLVTGEMEDSIKYIGPGVTDYPLRATSVRILNLYSLCAAAVALTFLRSLKTFRLTFMRACAINVKSTMSSDNKVTSMKTPVRRNGSYRYNKVTSMKTSVRRNGSYSYDKVTSMKTPIRRNGRHRYN